MDFFVGAPGEAGEAARPPAQQQAPQQQQQPPAASERGCAAVSASYAPPPGGDARRQSGASQRAADAASAEAGGPRMSFGSAEDFAGSFLNLEEIRGMSDDILLPAAPSSSGHGLRDMDIADMDTDVTVQNAARLAPPKDFFIASLGAQNDDLDTSGGGFGSSMGAAPEMPAWAARNPPGYGAPPSFSEIVRGDGRGAGASAASASAAAAARLPHQLPPQLQQQYEQLRAGTGGNYRKHTGMPKTILASDARGHKAEAPHFQVRLPAAFHRRGLGGAGGGADAAAPLPSAS